MTYLVLSDTHGHRDRVNEVLTLHGDAHGVLFLGDGIRDISPDTISAEGKLFAGVRGNCDPIFLGVSKYVYSEELLLNLGEYTVMMLHGHTRSVKSGLSCSLRYAAERGANVLLYGHTHISEETYLPAGTELDGYVLSRPMWVMNPGSLGAPREGRPSFGLLQLRRGQILLSHGNL